MFGRNWFFALLLAQVAATAIASTPDQPLQRAPGQFQGNAQWLVNGGEFKIRLNQELLAAKGVRFAGFEAKLGQGPEDEAFAVYPLLPAEGLQFNAPEGGFDRFTGGRLGLAGGFSLKLPDGTQDRKSVV